MSPKFHKTNECNHPDRLSGLYTKRREKGKHEIRQEAAVGYVANSIPDDVAAVDSTAHAIRGVLWAIPNRPWRSTRMIPPCPPSRDFR